MAFAPDSAQYGLVANTVDLPNGRQLSAPLNSGILLTDGGPGSFLSISADDFLGALQTIGTSGPNGFLSQSATNTAQSRTFTSDSTMLITNPAGIAGNPNFSVVPSSSVQLVRAALSGAINATSGTINFIPGANVGITVTSAGDMANITISASEFVNPMTTTGDIILGGASGVPGRLGIGGNGTVLKSNGTTAAWAPDAGLINPMTTAGDTIYGGVAGVPTRLSAGTTGQVLKISGGNPVWSSDTGFLNPMTTVGDLILGGVSGAAGRLGIGTTGQVVTVVGGTAAWTTPSTLTGAALVNFAGAASTPAVLSGGSLWVNMSGVLNFTNANNNYDVAFGTGAFGSILVGVNGGYSDLAIGTTGQVLTVVGGTTGWAAPTPMTTAGDLILGGVAGSAGRLGIGTTGQVLKVVGGTAAWDTDVGFPNPMTTAGDIITAGPLGAPARLAIGANTTIFASNGTTGVWGLGALGTGLLKNTTLTGATSIAIQDTDYWGPGTSTINLGGVGSVAIVVNSGAGSSIAVGSSSTAYALDIGPTSSASIRIAAASGTPPDPVAGGLIWVKTGSVFSFKAPAYTAGVADLSGTVVTANASNAPDATCGVGTLSSGTVFISTRSVEAGSLIWLNYATQSGGTYGNLVALPSAIIANTSFRVDSRNSSGTTVIQDNSTFFWLIVNPS